MRIHFWSNCQLMALREYLRRHHPDITTEYYLNFNIIRNKVVLPESFYDCDILIAQSTPLEGIYNLNEIKKKLSPSTKVITIPFVVFTGYFQGTKIPSGRPQIYLTCNSHPFGIWEEELKLPNLIDQEENVKISLEELRRRESISHVKGIADYIYSNFRKERLFYVSHHPCDNVLHLCYQQLLKFINKDFIYIKEELYTGFKKYSLPIHEELISSLNLTFEDEKTYEGNHHSFPNMKTYEDWYNQVTEIKENGSPICRCFHKKRELRFSHIAKTGGTSIDKGALLKGITWGRNDEEWKKAFNDQLYDFHLPLRYVKDKSFLSKYDFFCIVRNPYKKVVSHINFFYKTGLLSGDKRKIIDHYLQSLLPNTVEFGAQYNFVYDEEGNKLIKYVIRFENREEELKKLFYQYELDIPLLHENRSEYYITFDDFTSSDIAIINKHFEKDFITFNYPIIKT